MVLVKHQLLLLSQS